uniref:Katanin_con80 domain-containing protein n=1 Tax=Panagrellus redivivus TaxID=6233 RepID=A0A7E4ZVH0_PANRE
MQSKWRTRLETLPGIEDAMVGVIRPAAMAIVAANPLQSWSYDQFGTVKKLRPPREKTSVMALSADQRFVALGGDIVNILDLDRGAVARQLTDHTSSILGIAASPSSPHIWGTVGADRTIRMFDSRQHPGQVFVRRTEARYRCVRFAPADSGIFVGGDNIFGVDFRGVDMFTIRTPAQVVDIQCHPYDCFIMSCSEDKMVKVWDVETHECLTQSFALDSTPKRAVFSPDGAHIVASTMNKLYTMEWEQFRIVSQLSWATAKPSQFMVMDGEDITAPGDIATPAGPLRVDTLDLCFDENTLFHLGHAVDGNFLELCTASIDKLLSPPAPESARSPPLRLSTVSPPESVISTPDYSETTDISSYSNFTPTLNSTSIQSRITSLPVKKVLPRSTSASRPTPVISPPSSTKPSPVHGPVQRRVAAAGLNSVRSASNLGTSGMPPKVRSVSSHSLHVGLKRVNSGPDKGPKGPSPTTKRLPPAPAAVSKVPTRPVKPLASSGPKNITAGLQSGHADILKLIKRTATGARTIKNVMKSRNGSEDEVFADALQLPDKTVFAELLRKHVGKPKSLAVAARVLPELRMLMTSPNDEYVDISVKILEDIIGDLADSIRQGLLANRNSIGVDVTAERRERLCVQCKKALTELYTNASYVTEKLDESQALVFDTVIRRISNIVDA